MKKKQVLSFLLIGMTALSGCSKGVQGEAGSDSSAVQAAESETQSSTDTSDMFTDRDMEIGYNEEESVTIELSGESISCDSDAVEITESTVTIKDEGTYILSGKLTDGMVIVEADDMDKVQLVLDGAEISSSESAAIYVKEADKVFVTTASGSENVLKNGGTYTAIDENNIDAVIFSKSDLTLNGAGTLEINAAAGHGIVSKDDLVLTSGTYDITAESHGLSGKDSVRIANGTFTITAGKDAVHASNSDDTSLGFVYLADGTFDISSDDDGIHADNAVTICGGNINIKQSYEGIEGLSIDIEGGDLTVAASDDGLNAAGGNDSSGFAGPGGDQFASTEGAYIHISGGVLHVDASGDGIDSNGDLTVSGGETYLSGPTNSGNGVLDYSGEAVISGGIFVAAGSSGMAQNFGESSTQGVMMVTVDSQAGNSVISLADSDGTELVSWTAEKEYSSVIVSCPEISEGQEYTLTAGSYTEQITMDSLVYGAGGGMGGGGMDGGPGKNGEMPEGNGSGPGGRGEMPEEMPGEMEGDSGNRQMPEEMSGV